MGADVVVVGAAVVHHGRVLAARRAVTAPVTGDALGGWELPGGKVEPGETPEAAVVREVGEELGCTITVTGWLAGESAIRPGYVLRVALAVLASGEPVPHEHEAIRWLAPEELSSLAWLESDRLFLPELGSLLLDGFRLEGGNVGGAVRIGNTVRRATGPWTPAVHALLDHLAPRVPHVPQHHGLDERRREVLTYLPGRVVDVDAELLTTGQLVSVVTWTHALHEAVATFAHEGPWRFFGVESPTLIAHNDIAPYNMCFEGDELVGVFDWDLAGPSTPLLELAFIAWNCVPLWRDIGPALAARRLDVIAATYGVFTAAEILHAVPPRIQVLLDGIPVAAAAGDEGMANLIAGGEPEHSTLALADLARRIPLIEEELG